MTSASLLNPPLRWIMKCLHGLMKAQWYIRQPRTYGAHAVALTPAGRVVLVKLRYAEGWRLPGGGRRQDERPEDAVLRELREEIGMTGHGQVQPVCEQEERADFKRDLASLLIVRDVEYKPRNWSWEVEDLLETRIDQLPSDLSPRTARWLEAVRPSL